MARAVNVGFALAAIFSVATVLITPTTADDVTGILHRHHSQVSPPIVIRQLHDLFTVLPSSAGDFSAADLQLTLMLNHFRVRLC
jgi:hypothetical protein